MMSSTMHRRQGVAYEQFEPVNNHQDKPMLPCDLPEGLCCLANESVRQARVIGS